MPSSLDWHTILATGYVQNTDIIGGCSNVCLQELQEILARIDWFLSRVDEDEESGDSPTTDAQSPTSAS